VGLAVSALLLWWTLHDVALRDVAIHVRRARWGPFLGAVVLATSTFLLRIIRWRYLLQANGEPLRWTPLWHATAIGFMANNLLPARAGELARAYAVRRLTGVRFSAAVGSVAVERVLDGLVLVALMACAIVWGGFGAGTAVGGVRLGRVALVAGLVFLPALALAFGLVHRPQLALGAARWILQRLLPRTWVERVMSILEGLITGLGALRSPRRFGLVTAWSLALWVVSAASYWLGFVAFGLAAPPSAALLLQSLIAFGVAIPSSPGFFGPFEAVSRATLSLYGILPAQAVVYAVAYHIAVFVPISALGLWSLSRAHLHLADLKQVPATNARPSEMAGAR
jgi:uncharacterized protein (TIRG00374 family)